MINDNRRVSEWKHNIQYMLRSLSPVEPVKRDANGGSWVGIRHACSCHDKPERGIAMIDKITGMLWSPLRKIYVYEWHPYMTAYHSTKQKRIRGRHLPIRVFPFPLSMQQKWIYYFEVRRNIFLHWLAGSSNIRRRQRPTSSCCEKGTIRTSETQSGSRTQHP